MINWIMFIACGEGSSMPDDFAPAASSAAEPAVWSKVERIKRQSDYLRGTIAAALASPSDHFSADDYQVLKFHGVYQQEDRDRRAAARQQGGGKTWIMMVRAKIPGGRLSAAQYLTFDDLATRYANQTLRLTTRQCIQLHHVSKRDLRPTIRALNAALVTTLGACGDVERNLMACPAPDTTGAASEVQRYARLLSDATLPRTRAYHEIWLNGEQVVSSREPDEEPLYGPGYLPRKFKSGLAIEGDNCIDVYSQDIGMVAHLDGGRLAGFTLLVGGGLGRSHTRPETHPAVAQPLGFVEPDALLPTVLAIIGLQRDHGERRDRHFARLKYLVERWGVPRFRAALEARLGRPLAPPRPLRWAHTGDHLGWHPQADGRWYLGVWVENGRIQDTPALRAKTAFRALVERFRPTIYLTPQQNVLFADLRGEDRPAVETLLRAHGVPLVEEVPLALRHSMACPAIPTCGLALAESERALPAVVRQIHADLAALGLDAARLSIRMTGCPNGCARPYLGDIGFVGRTPGRYQIYVGGDFAGTRLSQLLADLVPVEELAPRLRPLFARYAVERRPDEGFGDWCTRVGIERLRAVAFPERATAPSA
jgi:sulfite reductase (ferredoxin)